MFQGSQLCEPFYKLILKKYSFNIKTVALYKINSGSSPKITLLNNVISCILGNEMITKLHE